MKPELKLAQIAEQAHDAAVAALTAIKKECHGLELSKPYRVADPSRSRRQMIERARIHKHECHQALLLARGLVLQDGMSALALLDKATHPTREALRHG